MNRKVLVEIDGKKYMSPKAAGDLWDMSTQKVTAECKAGRVAGATTDTGGHYIIPIDAKKPLDSETIRKILISLLAMKNRPGSEFIDEEGAFELHDYLCDIGLIEGDDLKTAILTNKGMELATSGKPIEVDWVNASLTVFNILGTIMSIWGAVKG